MHDIRLLLMVPLLLALLNAPVIAQVAEEPPPELPPLEDVEAEAGYVYDPVTNTYIPIAQPEATEFVPMNLSFRIGVIGDYIIEVPTTGGPQTRTKTPLILVNPRDGDIGVYAKNFPARIVANSPNGNWIIGVAESSSVEGSSGSRQRECAVSLNMNENDISIIEEFPIFSKFQAFFAPRDNNRLYYCVNEPATVNSIKDYDLRSEEDKPLEVDGNRFYLYGMKPNEPRGIWVEDPFSLAGYPVLNLVDLQDGHTISSVKFPGATTVIPNPSGDYILAVVENGADASLGYYDYTNGSFNQVPQLVLTRPTFKWTHNGLVVMAKESTATRDRFLMIDLTSGNVREVWSDYFKILFWDISPDDDALVFIVDSDENPILYVIPLDPTIGAFNRIRLTDVSNVSWIGCLNPPGGGGSWLERLLPF